MQETELEAPLMPDLLGMDLDRALRLLELAGTSRPIIRLVPIANARGMVVEQAPEPGYPIAPYQAVRLGVEEDNPIRVLPEIFQEEDRKPYDYGGVERPQHMLRNYLYIPQAVLTQLERRVVHMDRDLSPEGAPEAFLPWLEALFPMEWDASWPADRVRQVLKDAPKLLAKRGSAKGLEEMIELQTGVKVKVRENGWPQKGNVIGSGRIGEVAIVSTVPGADDAFFIELPADEEISNEQRERILRILDAEKPVHLRSMIVQPPSTQPLSGGGSAIGYDFIVGMSPVGGPVVTPPARIGVPGFVAALTGEGDDLDVAAWATEGLSAEESVAEESDQ